MSMAMSYMDEVCWYLWFVGRFWILFYTLFGLDLFFCNVIEVVNHWMKYLICTLHSITFAFDVMSPFVGCDLYRYSIIQCPMEGYDAHSYSVPWRVKSSEEHHICIIYASLSCGVKWMEAMFFYWSVNHVSR
jgi:hypothetical protein